MRVGPFAALVSVALAAGCGGDTEAERPRDDPFTAVGKRLRSKEPARAAPRWMRVASFSGSGAAVRRFEVERDAIQWRVRWRCQKGALALMTARAGAPPER